MKLGLRPHFEEWVVMDSNHRRRAPADLQSAPFVHSGNHPINFSFFLFASSLVRASCRIRTNDPEITNHVLWPTELKRRFAAVSSKPEIRLLENGCKVKHYFLISKTFDVFFHFLCVFSLNFSSCIFRASTQPSIDSSNVSVVFSA